MHVKEQKTEDPKLYVLVQNGKGVRSWPQGSENLQSTTAEFGHYILHQLNGGGNKETQHWQFTANQ